MGRVTRGLSRHSSQQFPQEALSADHEWSRFLTAQSRALADIDSLKTEAQASGTKSELPAVLEGYELLLTDVFLVENIKTLIFYHHVDARGSIEKTFSEAKDRIASAPDQHLKEKAFDVDACKEFLIDALDTENFKNQTDQLNGRIVIVSHPSPQDIIRFHHAGVSGILAEHGSQLSHAAILARSFNIPALFSVPDISKMGLSGQICILDCNAGTLTLNPSRSEVRKAEARRAVDLMLNQKLKSKSTTLARTTDGHRVFVFANSDGPTDSKNLLASGAEGIGLLRTEFLHLGAGAGPTIQESALLFRILADAFSPKWVTIRLLDAGGDKSYPEGQSFSSSPFGVRGIRFLLSESKILRNQLTALIKANHRGNIRVLIPFVTDVEEVRAVKRIMNEIWTSLPHEDTTALQFPQIGAMIETPAALQLIDHFIRECDFLSVGSNDLTQHVLCVDRADRHMQTKFNSFHPAVLRTLKSIFSLQRVSEISISLCGELASEPIAQELLLGLGCRQISAQASAIPLIKDIIRHLNVEEAEKLAEKVLMMTNAEEIRTLLTQRYEEVFDYSASSKSFHNRAV